MVNELRLGATATGYSRGRARPGDRGAAARADRARARRSTARAEQAADEPETEQHERRAERAGYLREKLDERAEAEDAAAREGMMEGHEEQADEAECELAEMEEQSDALAEDIEAREGRLAAEEAGRLRPRRRAPATRTTTPTGEGAVEVDED